MRKLKKKRFLGLLWYRCIYFLFFNYASGYCKMHSYFNLEFDVGFMFHEVLRNYCAWLEL